MSSPGFVVSIGAAFSRADADRAIASPFISACERFDGMSETQVGMLVAAALALVLLANLSDRFLRPLWRRHRELARLRRLARTMGINPRGLGPVQIEERISKRFFGWKVR